MITVTGRLVACIVLLAAGSAFVALVTFAAASNRVTRPEVLGGLIAFIVLVVAAAWLRRDALHGSKP